jgi:LysM domain
MAEDAPNEPGRTLPADAPQLDPRAESGERAGDFERYALVAALTLVVLCLLIWDNWQGGRSPAAAPRADRTLRVELGGAPPGPGKSTHGGDASHVTIDAPPVAPPPSPPPAAPERTCTVRGGDTLGGIAKRELGSASRAGEIARLNGISDPAKIREGQVLRLPAN